MRIGIFVYNEVEVLDFCGPFEVFSVASRLYKKRSKDAETDARGSIHVDLISEYGGEIVARGGLRVSTSYSINKHPQIDVLLVPGGIQGQQMTNNNVIEWIKHTGDKCTLVASVCTGAFLLARAGQVVEEEVSTHWENIEELQSQFPTLRVKSNTKWVDSGRVVTSAGISAGIDMSLYLVERCFGRALALKTARQMEYDWQ